jgi:predicted GNAT superfamily acetyltransferase
MQAWPGLTVRALESAAEMRQVVALECEVWGAEEATPANQLIISVKAGGHVLGAFADDLLVAFAYAFPAILPGRRPWLASHMLATRPGYDGRGVGRMLKWRQRDWALEHGFDRITWTFDPLEARNCHLNLNVLGAVAPEYVVDCYGTMDDKLNFGLPSDRLIAHWQLESARVLARRAGAAPTPPPATAVRVPIPAVFQTVKATSLEAAMAERMRVRDALRPLLEAGQEVVAYERERSELIVAARA